MFVSGSVYVFLRTGDEWAGQQKLVPLDAGNWEFFGSSVSIDGDTIVAGAPKDTRWEGEYLGAAYVFVRSGNDWAQHEKLIASDAASWADFGGSVSIDGGLAVVGALGIARSVSGETRQGSCVAVTAGGRRCARRCG
ncbi:MAG: FG-GAP repeat protein [Deltaproteobacteria bacterium]|nr:FG-GAP repeat protein [Deltaproteobacteria bacterium]